MTLIPALNNYVPSIRSDVLSLYIVSVCMVMTGDVQAQMGLNWSQMQ